MPHRLEDGTVIQLRQHAPSGSIPRRLRELEVLSQSAIAKPRHQHSHQEWLEQFSLYACQGHFENEPDFTTALEEYREAIRTTAADPQQGYHPPPEFVPHARLALRESLWREGRVYPAIHRALEWLVAMYERVMRQEPGVPLSEWHQLQHWFLTHWHLWQNVDDELLDGKSLAAWARRIHEDNGRTVETTELIRLLRRLWAQQYVTEPPVRSSNPCTSSLVDGPCGYR